MLIHVSGHIININSTVFLSLDLASEYYSVPVHHADKIILNLYGVKIMILMCNYQIFVK